jgi:hypothetical protein
MLFKSSSGRPQTHTSLAFASRCWDYRHIPPCPALKTISTIWSPFYSPCKPEVTLLFPLFNETFMEVTKKVFTYAYSEYKRNSFSLNVQKIHQ